MILCVFSIFILMKYTKQFGLDRLFLHAANIKFIHPATEQWMEINAPMERKLEKVLAGLRKKD